MTQLRLSAAQPGGLSLQSGILLTAIPGATFLLAAVYLLLFHLGTKSSALLQLAGFMLAAGFAYAFAKATFKRALAIAAVVYLMSLALASFFVDLSFDGQDYHYTAVWALANGWNPYRGGVFEDFAAPASDVEPWAKFYPKGDWLYQAVEVASGLGYETAKNGGLMLAAAALLCAYGALRQLGAGAMPSVWLAICAAANPVSLVQLFTRMCDGRLGSLVTIFSSLAVLAVRDRQWRFAAAALLPLVMAINTKFSMVPVFFWVGGVAALAVLISHGVKSGVKAGALLVTSVLLATFVIGWDPYLRNTVHNGNPFYPLMGANRIDIVSDSTPAGLGGHSALARLGLSVLSATDYEGPRLKIPFTISAEEFDFAGDPEPRVGGFGPFFLPGVVLATAALFVMAWGRRQMRGPDGLLITISMGLLLSVLTMPQSWLARYVPQLWLFPVFIAAAGILSAVKPARYLGWLAILVLLIDSGTVAASSLKQESAGSIAIHRQVTSLKSMPTHLCANFGASPARWALLAEAGLTVAIRDASPPPGCRDVQPMPYVFFQMSEEYGDICQCP